jgi:uncharacterized protein (TIGR03084 family)
MAVSLDELAGALRTETASLDRVIAPLDDAAWRTPTPAQGWTVLDQIAHLAHFDDVTTLAARDPDRFRAERDAAVARGEAIVDAAADRTRALAPDAVLAWFRRARVALLDTLPALDPATRVPWYGPDMSAASALTARIMETWAHAQDVFDALGAPHPSTEALRHVAHIGVRTFANSFTTHGRPVPDATPAVVLHASDGDAGTWTWGDAAATERVEGDAVEFCLVVTQRRHVDDTRLRVDGPVANEWMHIAQAFAGPPGNGRAPIT